MNKPETTPPTYFHHLRYGTTWSGNRVINPIQFQQWSEREPMETVRDTHAMLAGMMPVLKHGSFIFCSTSDAVLAEQARPAALSWFREDEGTAMILELEVAASLGFDTAMPMNRIVLEVFSALDGVGLTAAVSTALAGDNIPCNMVSAYHHDNVFVPVAMADRTMHVLRSLQAAAQNVKPR